LSKNENLPISQDFSERKQSPEIKI